MYNLTNLTSATTAMGIVKFGNEVTGGILMMLFVMAVFFVLLMATKRYGFSQGLVTSGFISFIFSSVLAYAKVINIMLPLLFLAITAFTGMYLYISRR